jgi:PAS domain S-box-containing protein
MQQTGTEAAALILLGSPKDGPLKEQMEAPAWRHAGLAPVIVTDPAGPWRLSHPPELLVVGPDVANARRAGARLRRAYPRAQLVFLVPDAELPSFKATLAFAPEMSGATALAAGTPLPQLVEAVRSVLTTSRNERALGGLFEQVNAMLSRKGGRGEPDTAVPKDRQRQLIVAERYLETLVNHAPVALFAADPQGRLFQLNRAAEELFAVRLEDAPEWVSELFAPEDAGQVRHLVARAASGHVVTQVEVGIARADERRVVELSLAPVEGPGGAIEGISCGAHDITERRIVERELSALASLLDERVEERTRELAEANKALLVEMEERERAETQIRQMQKMEAIGALTGGIAHDFNNMLAVVLGGLNLVERHVGRGQIDQLPEFLAATRDGAERAAALTKRLLAFARQQPLSPQPLNPNELVSGMSELLHRTLGETIHLETVLAAGLWTTLADPGQLENALINLAVNARDAMPEGGRLTIETANSSFDDAYAAQHAVAAGQYVMFAVTDSGTGMSAEVRSKVFEPFFTTKGQGKGTGLGMSQVFGFVKQSGGHIQIYSELGQGTTVKVYLPRHYGEGATPPRTGPARLIRGSASEVILLVEDDDRVRNLTKAMLVELQYGVLEARSGEEALRVLDEHPEVVLLLTDVVMPGMNGRQLVDAATARRPDLKVIFTTGYTRNAIVHNGILDPGVQLLPKPATLAQLAEKLRAVLDA